VVELLGGYEYADGGLASFIDDVPTGGFVNVVELVGEYRFVVGVRLSLGLDVP
jgi:hypothetical protein